MKIRNVTHNKKAYMDLLLLADEQEDMIDRYLERGDMFVLEDGGVLAECVVTREGDGVYELKNIAVAPDCQRKGYGKRLIEFAFSYYGDCERMLVGTGDVPSSLGFITAAALRNPTAFKTFLRIITTIPCLRMGSSLWIWCI